MIHLLHSYKRVEDVDHSACGFCFRNAADVPDHLKSKYPKGYCPHSFKVCKCGKMVGYGSHGKLSLIPDGCKAQVESMKSGEHEKMKRKELIDSLYHAEVWLYWDCTAKEMERDINRRFGEKNLDFSFDKSMAGVTSVEERKDKDNSLKRMIYVVWFSKMCRVDKLYSLVHECDHLVNRIFLHRGITVTFMDCEEHHAYYLEAWFKRIWRLIG